MLWFNKTRSSDSRASLFWGPLVLAAVVAAALPPAVLGACPQTNLSAIYISSWSSYGFQNFVRIDEGRAPDTVSGKGPYLDPHDYYSNPAKLMVSYNVLGFQIPQLSSPVVSAELQLQVRYLVSFRGSEVYQCGALTDPRVKVAVHRTLGAPLYDDPEANAVYGQGAVSITDGFVVTISLGSDFIGKLADAAGTKFLIQGALNSLDNDPYNAEYLYLNAATLILTFANDKGPEIVAQPLGHAIKAGAAVDFHVAACGNLPLFYQWKFNDTILPNATNSSLFLQNASPAQSGNYSVVVSNALGSVPSATAFLQVSQLAPYFAIQPGSSTIDAGRTNFFLRGLAAGARPPDYQWRFNDVALDGATNNVLPFGVVTPVNAGSYTLFASNSSGSVTSSPALLKVVPFYIIGPSDLTALLGNQDTLRVQFSGQTPPTNWLWFHNGVEIPGATNSDFTFLAMPELAGQYFGIGWNQYGSVTSQVATLTVISQEPRFTGPIAGVNFTFIAGRTNYIYTIASGGPPPVYFWYHDGALVPDQHDSGLALFGALADAGQYSVIASNEVGTATNGPATVSIVPAQVFVVPSPVSVGAGSALILQASYQGVFPVSYQWLYDPSPFTGTDPSTFHGTPVAGETNSSLFLTAVSTNQVGAYAVRVTNIFGSITSAPAQMQVYTLSANVYGLPESIAGRTGDFVWLAPQFQGAPRPVCQWKFNGVNIPGATNFVLPLSNLSTQNAGVYSVVASNFLGTSLSGGASSTTLLSVATSGPLDDWTSINPDPQANPLKAVALGNGRRVAVGENGSVLVSVDGQTWSTRHLGKGVHLHAIAFGNGLFAAAGHADTATTDVPVILTSPDGFTWTAPGLTAGGRINGIVFGGNRFIAVGATVYGSRLPVALTSSNGVVWSSQYLSASMYNYPLSAICFGNGLFVAVSDYGYSGVPDIFSSADGQHWTPGVASTYPDFEAVTAGNGSFVAVGDGGAVAQSVDGVNWTIGTISDYSSLKAVTYGNSLYVAAGDSGASYVSSDGLSWQSPGVASAHGISGLVFGAGQFTAVADAGRLLVSSNAQNWVDQCIGPDSDLYGIAQGPSAFVAVGDAAILYSSNRTDWTALESTRKLHGVTYGNGLFVAVGKKGAILTAPDGLNWTTRSVNATGYVERVIFANNRFVGVGEDGLIVTSPDGTNWTKVPAISPADLEGIAYGNGVYVAVGGYFADFVGAVTTVLTSSDGTHWTDEPSVGFFGVRARGVTFGNGQFVLVGNDGLTASSTTGHSWSDSFFGHENLRAVTYAAGHFIAVGNEGVVLSSLDGIDWAFDRCFASMNLRDVIASADAVIALGSNGEILQSQEIRPGMLARLVAGGFELKVAGGLAPECSLQGSADLRHWTDLFTYTNSAPATFLDPQAVGMPARFYRLIPR